MDIHPFEAGMTPPLWPLVPAGGEAWVRRAGTLPDRLAAGGVLPEVLAELHNGFERVHPFLDGNGRTGRLVLNMVLVRLGYPPVVILKAQRERYLRAMQRADEGDCGPRPPRRAAAERRSVAEHAKGCGEVQEVARSAGAKALGRRPLRG